MRIIIEIEDDIHTELRNIAAEREHKGYSKIVNKALRGFFEKQTDREKELEDIPFTRGFE